MGIPQAPGLAGSLSGQIQVGETDAFLAKYDRDGVEVWTRQFGTGDEDRAEGVDVDGQGDLYVVGWTIGRFPGHASLGELSILVRTDAFVSRFDSDGLELWTRQFGNKDAQSSNGVVGDDSGNFYVVGQTLGSIYGETHNGTTDAFIVKFRGGPDQIVGGGESGPAPLAQADGASDGTSTQVPPVVATALPTSTTTIPAATPAPAVPEQSSGGGCNSAPGGSGKADIGWLMLLLAGPGLMLVRKKGR